MSETDFDLCVIGGGINGAGIARDAAGRGLSVLLVEAKDLASGTSSASTKLIHGGLRYLEYYDFKLVRESLKEREVLLSLAPHIIWPMDFVLPHTPAQRSGWMIRMGLFLYDHLASRKVLKGSRALSLAGHDFKKVYTKGFQYSDCWADDSRLVVLNAIDAAEKGATILTRHVCTQIKDHGAFWSVNVRDEKSKSEHEIKAAMVINAAGPWVGKVIADSGLGGEGCSGAPLVRLVKGSHIIVERIHEGEQAYILQQSDNRIVFVIPYEGHFTLIGTTEEDYKSDPRHAMISDVETGYLIDAHNAYFEKTISKENVLWSYSGVRPLFDDGHSDEGATSVSRDFKLHVHADHKAPMISVFGGKLTTYRVLAECAVNKILSLKGVNIKPWTASQTLPGGDIYNRDFKEFLAQQYYIYEWLPEDLIYRYARSYGTRMNVFLEGAKSIKDLGQHFGEHIYEAEIVYLLRYEFAQEAEDIFWRRSKLGLHVQESTIESVAGFIRSYRLRHGGVDG